jgi:uncharacterized protein
MTDQIDVIKLDIHHRETWRYTGSVLRRWPNAVLLQALFDRDDISFHEILLRRGDRFVEIFYTDRWYNIFEIHDRDTDQLKGWYCNITMPAELHTDSVSYVDLALDLLVYPDGRQLVLDEDEFDALPLEADIRRQARASLDVLCSRFRQVETFKLDQAALE